MKASNVSVSILVALGAMSDAAAQTKPPYEVGLRLSTITYQGDLTPSFTGSARTMTLGVGVFGTKILNSKFAVRANLDYNRIKGDDAAYSKPEWRQQRNLRFTTSALELTGHLVYSPRGNYNERRLSPYLFGGASFTFLKVNRDYSGFSPDYFATETWVGEGLAADIAKAPPRFTFTIPVGAGVKYPVTQKLSLFGEASYRLMLTDYLDGFSKAGDSKHKDHYSNISVGIVYRLGNAGINCPSY